MFAIAPNIIINAAKSMVNLPQIRNDTFERRWKSAFGASPEVCCLLWNKINPYKTMPTGVDPKHLLWALYFLTVYDTEHNSAHSLGKVDEKTYRKWSELFVDAISYLECEVYSSRQCYPLSFLNDNEMAVADSGYRGKMHHIKTPDLMHFHSERYYDAAVLVKRFRHSLAFHSSCFRAVAVITEFNIEAGESLFSVKYIDEGKKNYLHLVFVQCHVKSVILLEFICRNGKVTTSSKAACRCNSFLG
ncbi:LOW QUALITY PROTEIN: hypothetical protein ACHAW5_011307 [Stephanodiscus triporus]|uniref:Uncharacterized protein n=1 Tax=Stephanodiscus triporus TaxID=2934178 RepID=A0ABD3Q5A7_9STRA